jgi:hypothetical protein
MIEVGPARSRMREKLIVTAGQPMWVLKRKRKSYEI